MIGAACVFTSLLNCVGTGLDAKPSAVFSFDAKAKRKLQKWNQNSQGCLCTFSGDATGGNSLGSGWLQKPIVSAI
jgi:hypothetical protein